MKKILFKKGKIITDENGKDHIVLSIGSTHYRLKLNRKNGAEFTQSIGCVHEFYKLKESV